MPFSTYLGHFPKLFLCSGHVLHFILICLPFPIWKLPLPHSNWFGGALKCSHLPPVTGEATWQAVQSDTLSFWKPWLVRGQTHNPGKAWVTDGSEAGVEKAAILSSGISSSECDLILQVPANVLRPPRQSVSASEVTEANTAKSLGERMIWVTQWALGPVMSGGSFHFQLCKPTNSHFLLELTWDTVLLPNLETPD